MASERRAIVMISIGDRAWSKKSSKTFEYYCEDIGADLHVVTKFPDESDFPFPTLPDSPGRKNKLAYACKAFFAWKYLEDFNYDRVVVIDDTCCVKPGCPDIFKRVPLGSCGFTGTSSKHAEHSFGVIRNFIESKGEAPIEYDPKSYMNSGVMVYDKTMKHALHKDKICRAAPLLFAKYPNQTLTYYLIKRANIPMQKIPKSFNSIPAMDLEKADRSQVTDIKAHINENINIYHITGAFKDRNLIVQQLADILLEQWEEYRAGASPVPAAAS